MPFCRFSTAAAGLSLILASLSAIGQTKRPIADTDLYSFQWIADPEMSPDGSRVVYTRVNVNSKHDNYETALWVISALGGEARQISAGPHDGASRWSPDGKTLAFVRATEKDGKPEPAQIFLLPMDGGEARQLTSLPKGAGRPVWSPDGRSIAFTSGSLTKDFETKPASEEKPSDVRVITRALYRNNGAGFEDTERPQHLWVVDVPGVLTTPVKARQVTTGEFSETDAVWARDGRTIYFTSDRKQESYYDPPRNAIYAVSAMGGDLTKITETDGRLGGMALSPDGSRMAFMAETNAGKGVIQRSYSQPDLWVTALEPGSKPKNLTADYDFDIGGGVGGDQAPPRGSAPSPPYWTKDGRFVIVDSAEQGKVNLERVDVETGKMASVTTGNHSLYAFHPSADGAHIAVLESTPTNIGDLFVVDAASGQMKRLTHINQALFSQLNLTEPEMIWYNSFDGKRIQAWVQRPPDFHEGTKYPLILDIHGGPHAAYGYTFDHEFQWMAAKGYVVLYPNPRGSTSYGQDFGNIIQYHYPGDDYKDLMAGVDDLVKRGWVDPQKMGVTGGSGGGVLTNWVIGHTDRFKAAVSQRSIADWRDFWYTADFTQFSSSWFRGAPWESEADYKERSPITYVQNIHTPLMLVEGDSDLRTPPSAGGEQMFRALKYLKRPVVMVRFPGESHELSRSGNPRHRVERLDHIVGWFDKYLEGQDIHTYDVR